MMKSLDLSMPTHLTEALRTNMSGGKTVGEMLAEAAAIVPFMSMAELRRRIDAAERDGLLKPGGTIIEPSSGNTGIGLAAVGTARGYKVKVVLPASLSVERRALIQAYGGEVILTPGPLAIKGSIAYAKQLHDADPSSVILGQFDNPANSAAHEATTGPEIWEDTDGQVDLFVAGIGTVGTITGVGRYLKSKNPAVRVVGVEPATSAVLSGGAPGRHDLQGLGAAPSLGDPELHPLAGLERLDLPGQRPLRHVDVGSALLREEAEALVGVVPLDLASGHGPDLTR